MTKLNEKDRMQIREYLLQRSHSQRAIARMFSVSKSTIQRVSAAMDNRYVSKRECNYYSNQQIEQGVVQVVRKLHENGLDTNGPIIQSIALKLSKKLGFCGFSASNGWLYKFKKRNKHLFIQSKTMPEEPIIVSQQRNGMYRERNTNQFITNIIESKPIEIINSTIGRNNISNNINRNVMNPIHIINSQDRRYPIEVISNGNIMRQAQLVANGNIMRQAQLVANGNERILNFQESISNHCANEREINIITRNYKNNDIRETNLNQRFLSEQIKNFTHAKKQNVNIGTIKKERKRKITFIKGKISRTINKVRESLKELKMAINGFGNDVDSKVSVLYNEISFLLDKDEHENKNIKIE